VSPPPVRLYDSFQNQKVDFVPLTPGKVSMYLCGPTTYDAAHIGHAFSAICFDAIRRGLVWLGYQVLFVRNVTDVDDKIIKRAAEVGEDPIALSARYADEYNRDMAAFGVLPPDIEPRVSTHIAEIVALTAQLIERGKAYPAGPPDRQDVYYSVASFPDYGKLSGQSLDDLVAGARIEVGDIKRAPADFALWKAAKPGEPSWPSPWGPGRPGWHIECSAMTVTHLGDTFDIHGGGKDLIFPHHENEIAQSQGVTGPGTFARYWLHNGFLNFAGEKMSKSLGNVFACQQVAAFAGAEALRFFVVSHHYRSPTNFEVATEDGAVVFRDLDVADRRLAYFYATLERIDAFVAAGDGGDGAVMPEVAALVAEARAALCDDFNSSIVIAALGEAAKAANKLLDEGKGVDKGLRRRTLAGFGRELRSVGGALGILQADPASYLAAQRTRLAVRRKLDVAAVGRLLGLRDEARKAKDFARSDEIRDELKAMGVAVLDTPRGADWRIAE
jgi:cysteinyl-tRNA synthetase